MGDKTLEQTIIARYQGNDGNWVIPRGNVAAVKLLKEAVARIGQLKRDRDTYWNMYQKAISASNDLGQKRRKLEEDQKTFNSYMSRVSVMATDNNTRLVEQVAKLQQEVE